MNLKLALLDWAIVRPAAIAFENVNDDRRHMCALPSKETCAVAVQQRMSAVTAPPIHGTAGPVLELIGRSFECR
jgi:hypothetical protein